MTEKETLLCMIKNVKNNIPIFYLSACHNIICSNCYYNRKSINSMENCKTYIKFYGSKNKNIEQYYIKKFGYVSLIEELL